MAEPGGSWDRLPAGAERGENGRQPSVLVTGAQGFLAGFIIAALRRAGWRVVCAVRAGGPPDSRCCDFSRAHDDAYWAQLLEDIDAVVNVAGILRESPRQRFAAIHHAGPLALASACLVHGVRDFVQISALGDPDDGEFIASKHRFDADLLALPLRAVVLRPSVVYATAGSYGGTSLLRALAALPLAVPLPGAGAWPMQPLAAEDLGTLVVAALAGEQRGMFEVGCAQPLSLRDYLLSWRAWLRRPGTRTWSVPVRAVDAVVAAAEYLGAGPMGDTMWRMLKRGNVCAAGAHARLQKAFGCAPRDLHAVLSSVPSQVQDRWQAELYLLAPLLRAGVVLLCLISAWAGFATPAAEIEALTAASPLVECRPVVLARLAGGVDLLLALWLVSGWRSQAAVGSLLLLVVGYTLLFGTLLPALWLDPLGGLAKNVVLLPALAVLWVLSDRR
jgi:uncharacterized protein YbjT (DUF2867 family)